MTDKKMMAAAAMGLAAMSVMPTATTKAAVVINEVYGGGGSAATTGAFNTDFIELYNNDLINAVDLSGLSVRYASATGTFTTGATSNVGTIASGVTLAPGAFFLIAGGTSATFGGPALPTADASSNIAASATAGKVALFAADGTTILDLVAYGSSATGGEGASAPTLTTATSAQRRIDGLDTNVNSVDFAASAPTPRAANVINAVPEPTALGLIAVGSALSLRRRKAR